MYMKNEQHTVKHTSICLHYPKCECPANTGDQKCTDKRTTERANQRTSEVRNKRQLQSDDSMKNRKFTLFPTAMELLRAGKGRLSDCGMSIMPVLAAYGYKGCWLDRQRSGLIQRGVVFIHLEKA